MTAPRDRRRWLRPGTTLAVGDHLWVVDVLQPVAAVLDATGAVVDVVGWSEVPPGPEPRGRRVLAAPDGLWVQQPGGPVVLVGREGVRSGHHAGDLTLAVSTRHGAWCAEARVAQGWTVGDDTSLRPVVPGELRLLRPGRVSRTVRVDARVRSLRSAGGDLFVEVEARVEGRATTSWLRLAADEAVPDGLGVRTHGCDEALVPPPLHREPGPHPRVAVDVTARCWPLGAPPLDAEDHAALSLARFSDLDHTWTDEAGRAHPLARGMTDTRTALVGTWPDTRLEITFAWDRRPGLRLRRTVRLYDELGRVVDHELAGVALIEDLDTGRVPPASAAEAGVLDV